MHRGRAPRGGASLQTVLTLIFYVLALGSVVSYFAWPDQRYIFMTVGIAAIAVRVVSYLIKLIK